MDFNNGILKVLNLLLLLGALASVFVAAEPKLKGIGFNNEALDAKCIFPPGLLPGGKNVFGASTDVCLDAGVRDMNCGVPVGAEVSLTWEFASNLNADEPHGLAAADLGPCAVYLKHVGPESTPSQPEAGWFKLGGYSTDADGRFCTANLRGSSTGALNLTVPLHGLRKGFYLLRAELVSLKDAARGDMMPKMFVGCAEIFVPDVFANIPMMPSTISIPGPEYPSVDSPGMDFDVFPLRESYPEYKYAFGPATQDLNSVWEEFTRTQTFARPTGSDLAKFLPSFSWDDSFTIPEIPKAPIATDGPTVIGLPSLPSGFTGKIASASSSETAPVSGTPNGNGSVACDAVTSTHSEVTPLSTSTAAAHGPLAGMASPVAPQLLSEKDGSDPVPIATVTLMNTVLVPEQDTKHAAVVTLTQTNTVMVDPTNPGKVVTVSNFHTVYVPGQVVVTVTKTHWTLVDPPQPTEPQCYALSDAFCKFSNVRDFLSTHYSTAGPLSCPPASGTVDANANGVATSLPAGFVPVNGPSSPDSYTASTTLTLRATVCISAPAASSDSAGLVQTASTEIPSSSLDLEGNVKVVTTTQYFTKYADADVAYLAVQATVSKSVTPVTVTTTVTKKICRPHGSDSPTRTHAYSITDFSPILNTEAVEFLKPRVRLPNPHVDNRRPAEATEAGDKPQKTAGPSTLSQIVVKRGGGRLRAPGARGQYSPLDPQPQEFDTNLEDLETEVSLVKRGLRHRPAKPKKGGKRDVQDDKSEVALVDKRGLRHRPSKPTPKPAPKPAAKGYKREVSDVDVADEVFVVGKRGLRHRPAKPKKGGKRDVQDDKSEVALLDKRGLRHHPGKPAPKSAALATRGKHGEDEMIFRHRPGPRKPKKKPAPKKPAPKKPAPKKPIKLHCKPWICKRDEQSPDLPLLPRGLRHRPGKPKPNGKGGK